jgi:hypothetical protein
MGQKYALPEAYAQALFSLISEVIEELVHGQKPGVATAIAFRIELHLEKVYADALSAQSVSHEKCAIMLLDLLKYSNLERFNVRQWQAIYTVVESWRYAGNDLEESGVDSYRKLLEASGLELHTRDSYIRAMGEE